MQSVAWKWIDSSFNICVFTFALNFLQFMIQLWFCETILIVWRQILTCQNLGRNSLYCKNVFGDFWREKNNSHMDCTTMKKPPSQTLLNQSILSSAVSPELYSIIKCAPPLSGNGGELSLLPNFQNGVGGGGWQDLNYGGSLRNLILGEFMKNQFIERELSKKGRGAETICKFKRGLGKKEGLQCFWGVVDTPMHTMIIDI